MTKETIEAKREKFIEEFEHAIECGSQDHMIRQYEKEMKKAKEDLFDILFNDD